MDSPRSGFRRAKAASWALAGLGVAGVATASGLAYGDTAKPAAPPVTPDSPPATTVVEPAPATTVVEPPPSRPIAPPDTPIHTPSRSPEPTTVARSAPVAPAPTTTKRRNLTPSTVMAPNYSPRITVSHGS
jgi:hypothetical protein